MAKQQDELKATNLTTMTKELDVEDDMEELLNETTVEMQGEEQQLGDLYKEIQEAHRDLDDFKSGALALSKTLDERRMQAKNDGDETLVMLLDDMKDLSFSVYLRLQRGDLELFGERDGKYSGYFADEQAKD